MFAVCNAKAPLSEAVFYNCSYTRALQMYYLKHPNVKSVCIYADVCSKLRLSDLVFIKSHSAKQLKLLFPASPPSSSY